MKNSSTHQLERLAKRLLMKHGVASPPVPLETLAKQLGAEVRVASVNKALRGFFVAESGGVLKRNIIFVNAAHPRSAQRWTLAHELGHMLLANREIHVDWPDSPNRRGESKSKVSDREEILADQLALELLLPKHMLSSDIEHPLDPHDDESLERLASRYQVSLYALISRLEQVRLLQSGH